MGVMIRLQLRFIPVLMKKKFEERKSQIENYIKKLNTTLPTMKRIGQIYIKESELSKTAMGKIKRN